MITELTVLAAEYSTSSDEGGLGILLLIGPAGAAGVYWALYSYYRNTKKSHAYERETLIEAKPITGNERKIGENNGTSNSSIAGGNESNHRARVKRW